MSEARFFFREWRSEALLHVAVAVLLGLGFMMYAFLYGWATSVGGGLGRGVADLPLPGGADVVVVEPAWLLHAVHPDFNLDHVLTGPPSASAFGNAVSENTAKALGMLRERVASPDGTVWAFGAPAAAKAYLGPGLPFVAGGWPSGGGEVALPDDMARRLGMQPGDSFWTGVSRWPDGAWREATWRVSGVFRVTSPLLDGVIVDEAALADLTGDRGHNMMLLWQRTPLEPNWQRHKEQVLLQYLVPEVLAEYQVREPLLPMEMRTGIRPGTAVPRALPDGLPGLPAPFALTEGPVMATSGYTAEVLAAIGNGARTQSSPVVFLVLVLILAAVTVLSVIRVLDRQRVLGVFKALGFSASGIRRANQWAAVADAALGTAIGALGFALAAARLSPTVHVVFHVTWSLALGWLGAVVFLVWWQGAVVAILFHHTDARSLLLRAGRFDWWALLRFDLTKPAA